MMTNPLADTVEKMIDLKDVDFVEIMMSHDGTKIWVNTELGCKLRIYGIKEINILDERKGSRH